MTIDPSLRRVVKLVLILNLAYFGVEFAVARAIGSVSLFADSIDFLEDASINLLIFVALDWTARKRAHVGMALAGILLVPGLATLWTAWEKLTTPIAPDPALLSLTGLGALAVNLSCALILTRYRRHGAV
jgi:Co/Zn/Cd efflux system component